MRVLCKLSGWAGKGYCFPSQIKIVKLCGKWCGVSMSRRTLNRVLGGLETGQFLNRVRRHRKGPDGTMIFHSTLYKLTWRSFNWLGGLARFGRGTLSLFRVPKVAQYLFSSERGSSSPVDKSGMNDHPAFGGPARAAPIILQFRTL